MVAIEKTTIINYYYVRIFLREILYTVKIKSSLSKGKRLSVALHIIDSGSSSLGSRSVLWLGEGLNMLMIFT